VRVGTLVREIFLVDECTVLVTGLVDGTDAVQEAGGQSCSIRGAAESEDDGGDSEAHDEWGVGEWMGERTSWVGRLMKSWVDEGLSG
jgi:hypothetical protein